jgi:hypothetical protein
MKISHLRLFESAISAEVVYNNCKSWFNEVGFDFAVTRGMKVPKTSEIQRFESRTGRYDGSSDSEIEPTLLHKLWDTYFEKNYGHQWRHDKVVYVDNHGMSYYYGQQFVICPIGKYSYLWSEDSKDLTNELYQYLAFKHGDEDNDDIFDVLSKYVKSMDDLNEFFDDTGIKFKSTNITDSTGQEIMIRCDAYFAIPVELWDNIKRQILRLAD